MLVSSSTFVDKERRTEAHKADCPGPWKEGLSLSLSFPLSALLFSCLDRIFDFSLHTYTRPRTHSHIHFTTPLQFTVDDYACRRHTREGQGPQEQATEVEALCLLLILDACMLALALLFTVLKKTTRLSYFFFLPFLFLFFLFFFFFEEKKNHPSFLAPLYVV